MWKTISGAGKVAATRSSENILAALAWNWSLNLKISQKKLYLFKDLGTYGENLMQGVLEVD